MRRLPILYSSVMESDSCMSVLAKKSKLTADKVSTNLQNPWIFLIGGLGSLIAIWAILTMGWPESVVLVSELVVLNIIVQLVLLSVQRTGVVFGVHQAFNLAAVALFGLPTGIVITLITTLAVWAVMTVRKRQSMTHSAKTLLYSTGMEVIAVAVSGLILTVLRSTIPVGWLIVRPIAWLIAAIANDQLNLAMLATTLYLQKGSSPIDFWKRNVWAMPINITIGALGGVLLYGAISTMGFRGMLIFIVPLVLSAYAFHMYVRAHEAQQSTAKGRTGELELANKQLTQVARRKEQALDTMTVKIEEPLNGIRSALNTLIETHGMLSPERRTELLSSIATHERSITSLLESASQDEDTVDEKAAMPGRLFNLSELVEQVTDMLDRAAKSKRLRLLTVTGDDPIYIEADEQKLREVIMHLTTNAIKYTPEGGSVFVRLSIVEGKINLEVEDTGSGIPRSEIKSIFKSGYRVEKHQNTIPGKGLGLTIVNENVKAHDGTIDVESNVDLGSRFTVKLPMHISAPDYSDMLLTAPSIYTTQEFIIHARETIGS